MDASGSAAVFLIDIDKSNVVLLIAVPYDVLHD
jgi:hypothetical protein